MRLICTYPVSITEPITNPDKKVLLGLTSFEDIFLKGTDVLGRCALSDGPLPPVVTDRM